MSGRTLFVGHVGTIYQSSNAVLTGRSTPRYLTVLPDGTSLSDRALQISCGADALAMVGDQGRRSMGQRRGCPGHWTAVASSSRRSVWRRGGCPEFVQDDQLTAEVSAR